MHLKSIIRFLALVLFVPLEVSTLKGYRFKLDVGNPEILCPDESYTCSDESNHFLCSEDRMPKCLCHSPVYLSDSNIKIFLQGTNGIRNKVASDLNIANMNLVYWSEELRIMASAYLRECTREMDPCLIIGQKKVNVSQNSVFFRGNLVDRWPGFMVRHWYYELGSEIDTIADYVKKYKSDNLINITNLVNPLVEFIGCAAARFSDGYYIICYYQPQYNHEHFPADFIQGRPCTRCSHIRSKCSKTFSNLCGVDFEWVQENGAYINMDSSQIVFIVFLFSYLL